MWKKEMKHAIKEIHFTYVTQLTLLNIIPYILCR